MTAPAPAGDAPPPDPTRHVMLLFQDEPAFDLITGIVQTSLEVPLASVCLAEPDRQWLRGRAGFETAPIVGTTVFCRTVMAEAAPLAVADAAADPRFCEHPLVVGPPGLRSYLGVPIETPDGRCAGVLAGFDVAHRHFEARHFEVMANLARLAVDEIELRHAASIDPLTGVLQRRAFLARVDRLLGARDREPAALAILSVDGFRSVIESFGHGVGDEVLKGVAKHLCTFAQEADALGRLGGDEFGFLMPGLTSVEGLERMEKLRSILETAGVDAPVNVGVTTSIGLAPLAPAIRTTGSWLHVADKALYEAKIFGRNKTVIGDPVLAPDPPSGATDRRRLRDLPVESEVLSPLTVMRWVNNYH